MPEHNLRKPEQYVRHFEGTNEYVGLLSEGKDRAAALGDVAGMFAEKMAEREVQTIEQKLDRSVVHILSLLPGFIHAQRALDEIQVEERERHHRVSRREKLPHKRVATAYNHALRELIDIAPDLDVYKIEGFIHEAASQIGENQGLANYAAQETRAVLHGIQHEIGFEQILWELDDVEDVVHSDTEQELKGIDLIVSYQGAEIPLDVKASETSAQKALQAHDSFMRQHHLTAEDDDGGYPVWTGLDISDFHGGFRISQELAAQKAPQVRALLDRLKRQRKTA